MFQGKYILQAEPEAQLCRLAANLLLDFVCAQKPDLLGSFVLPPAKVLHKEDTFESLRFERHWFVHTTDATTLADLPHMAKLGKVRFRVNLKNLAGDRSKAYITSIFCRAYHLCRSAAKVVRDTSECLPINNEWLIAANNWLTGKTANEIASDFVPFLQSLTQPLFSSSYSGFVPPADWKLQPPPPPVYLAQGQPTNFPYVQLQGRVINTSEFNPATGVLALIFADNTRLLVKLDTFSPVSLATRPILEEVAPKQFDPFSL